jgi:hypothetical protein
MLISLATSHELKYQHLLAVQNCTLDLGPRTINNDNLRGPGKSAWAL